MMIDINKYNKILEDGLLLDHYVALSNIHKGIDSPPNKRVQGFINLLYKKGYIEDGVLTQKALHLLEEEVELVSSPVVTVKESKPKTISSDFVEWTIQLHKDCQKKLKDAKGKQQHVVNILGGRYSYLPNPTDLGKVILRAINTYNLKDLAKIRKFILAYVDRCIKTDNWTPLLQYWIMKGDSVNGMSAMVTEMENPEEETNDDTTVNI